MTAKPVWYGKDPYQLYLKPGTTLAGRVTTATSGIAEPRRLSLRNIVELIESGGQITIGAIQAGECAAIANDEDSCLAMLRRKPEETPQQLLERLDSAIERAWTTEQFTDEINVQPSRIKPR